MVADLLCAQHYFQPGEILDVCRLGELQGLQFGPIAWPVTGVSHLLTHFFFFWFLLPSPLEYQPFRSDALSLLD